MTEWHRPQTPHRPKLVCHKVQCLPGQSWWHPLLLQQSSVALWLWSQCRQHLPVLRWELARIDQADFASNFDLHLWNRELRFSGICIYIHICVCVKISTYMYYLIHSYTFHWKFTHYESADSKWFIVCRSQIRRINKHWDPLRPFQFFSEVKKASAIETKGVGKAPPALFDVTATTQIWLDGLLMFADFIAFRNSLHGTRWLLRLKVPRVSVSAESGLVSALLQLRPFQAKTCAINCSWTVSSEETFWQSETRG